MAATFTSSNWTLKEYDCYIPIRPLKRLERSQTGDKPFSCSQCDFKYSIAGALKRHERTDLGINHSVAPNVTRNVQQQWREKGLIAFCCFPDNCNIICYKRPWRALLVLIKKLTKSFELEFCKSAAKGLLSLEILSFKPLYDQEHIAKETVWIKKPSHINKPW